MSVYHPFQAYSDDQNQKYWTMLHDAQAQNDAIDPVELAVSQGHAVAIDLLSAILACQTPSRALQIAELMKPLIETLQTIELAALGQANTLNT